MTKAEMEAHHASYHEHLAKARAAEKEGRYKDAIGEAHSSWEFIDGMLQYARRYENAETLRIQGIGLVLRLAPLILDFRILDSLDGLLRETRRIEKASEENIEEGINKARASLTDSYRLFTHLLANPETRQDDLRRILGGDQDNWRSISEAWDRLAVVQRVQDGGSYRVSLMTSAVSS